MIISTVSCVSEEYSTCPKFDLKKSGNFSVSLS